MTNRVCYGPWFPYNHVISDEKDHGHERDFHALVVLRELPQCVASSNEGRVRDF